MLMILNEFETERYLRKESIIKRKIEYQKKKKKEKKKRRTKGISKHCHYFQS